MNTTETNLLDWQKWYGTEEACARARGQQRWSEGFLVRDVDMIMAMPSPRATVTNAQSVITKPRSRSGRCFIPPTAP